jgi:SAM-dependent methyltransferase
MARLESPGAVANRLRERTPAILDVRAGAAFSSAHLAGSGHVPADDLPWRLHELPFPRTEPLLVIADERELDASVALLESEGFDAIDAATFAVARLAGAALSSGEAASRLWRPTRFVIENWPLLKPDAGGEWAAGPILDLACGNGRNAVFMALQGRDVVACDLLGTALARTRALARSSGVRVGTWQVDLERTRAPLPKAAYAAILVFNYLHRPLLPAIREAVVPGGLVLYETFTVDQKRLFGKPRRQRFLLEKGELERLFEGFEIVSSREGIEEPGRAVASIVARRPRAIRV